VEALTERGAMHPLSLRFLDPDLERRYQRAAGAESLGGLKVITGASALLWAMAAFLIPIGTDLPPEVATPVALVMSGVSVAVFVAAQWTRTLDQQHALASILTAGNGLVILALAWVGGALPGYGVSAIMLLFAFGFVSRTRFIFAALRSAVIAAGFIIAAANWQGPSLLIDGFIFVAAVIGTQLALRLLERSRRRVFHQDLVIREQSEALQEEKEKSDRLLLNVLPSAIAARLREGESTIADLYPSVTVLFADVVGFTALAARHAPDRVVELLSSLFGCFDELVDDRGLEKIKTVGDSYMAVGGLPEPIEDHAVRVVDLGLAMLAELDRLSAELGERLEMRIGAHSGAAVGGVIGSRKFAFDLWGDTVNVASRLESQGVPNRVHVSAATWELVRDRYDCETRGAIELRGHGPMETYTIIRPRATAVAAATAAGA
jgi:class 3 adenylate cyclase